MPKRVDLDGGDSLNEIEDALRQLNQRQQAAERDTNLDRAVQEVAEQQQEISAAIRRVSEPSKWTARIAWIGIAIVVVGLIVAAAVFMRPEPPPPPAATAEDAVRGFWTCLIEGKYESATRYYPAMVTNYGSASQAADRLHEVFQSNPPASVSAIEMLGQVPDTTTYRVSYKVYMKSGQPREGEFIVTDTGTQSQGFVIINGGV